jgi:hypothetical protein
MRDVDWDDLRVFLAISEGGVSRTRLAQGQGSSARGRAQGEESERGVSGAPRSLSALHHAS